MIFEKLIRIPYGRVAILIGKSGATKAEIERSCHVKLNIDGETGEVLVIADDDAEMMEPYKAIEIIAAIGRGFSPQNALTLLEENNSFFVIDLRRFAGKSNTSIERIKGRLIGDGGRARRNMENLTRTKISVYGKTAAVIGDTDNLRRAIDAISALSNGRMHGAVYSKLEAANRKIKEQKMNLWEDQNVFY